MSKLSFFSVNELFVNGFFVFSIIDLFSLIELELFTLSICFFSSSLFTFHSFLIFLFIFILFFLFMAVFGTSSWPFSVRLVGCFSSTERSVDFSSFSGSEVEFFNFLLDKTSSIFSSLIFIYRLAGRPFLFTSIIPIFCRFFRAVACLFFFNVVFFSTFSTVE